MQCNSPLVSQITFTNNPDGSGRMTTTKSYDNLNRLTAISSAPSASSAVTFNYTYNSANQRTRRTESDSSYWSYQYDTLGQVTSGKKYWSDMTPVAGQQFEYGHDDIGNRTQTKAGGDASGAGLRPASYTANNLNQYTQRTVPGTNDVIGAAIATNNVTVNGVTAYRKVEYFQALAGTNNASAPAWLVVTVSSGGQSVTGNVFVARSPETFGYDADGNMTNDGRWALTWDAENRLTKAESLSSGPTASKRKVEWTYDAKGRRIRQTTSDGSSGSYVVTEDLKFLSDGWRHIAELNATNNSLIRSYVWGLDLSGSLDGAGGVGGLLMLNSAANGVHFYAYDGNGNVAALVKASDGTASANYEYEPFGVTLRATGLMAKENPFRFSTKRTDNTTDFALYEMRIYVPSTGRWPNRDPIGEQGGLGLYTFLGNDPDNSYDPLGLAEDPAPDIINQGNEIYYRLNQKWFEHPADEGKPCCCDPSAKLTKFVRTDSPPTVGADDGTLHFKVEYKLEGCFKDASTIWATCTRPSNGTGYKLESGRIPRCDGADSCDLTLPKEWGPELSIATIRYLSCEKGKWVVRKAKAGLTYIWTGKTWQAN